MKKTLKQVLAVSLIMTCILQLCVIPHASAAAGSTTYSAVDDIELLNKLGFVSRSYGPKKGDDYVTRGQFANILGHLRGFDEDIAIQDKYFMDIPADYWCAGQIYSLYDAGIINGTTANTFSPNDLITYPQVIKCLVSLLGYDMQAQQLGGYPSGYLSVASQIGLYANSAADEINYATIAKLVVKAMDTEVMEYKFAKDNGITLSKSKDSTPLSMYNDIYYDTGIMTDNGLTSLTGTSTVGQKSVIIDKKTIKKGDANVNEYLGYRLKYYYKDVNDDLTLLFVLPYNTEVVTLKDEDLDFDNPNYSFKTIYNNAVRGRNYYKISDYFDVIYNGKAYPEFTLSTLKFDQGTMVLIDNDMDGNYDVICVNEYYDMYISSVDKTGGIIYGKNGKKVDCSNFESVEYVTDGKPSSIASFKGGQILSVFESKDGKLLKVVSSGEILTGKVETIKEYVAQPDVTNAAEVAAFKNDAPEMRFLISDIEYALAYDYILDIANGYQGAIIPEAGSAYLFRLDMNGKIAAVETAAGGSQYAYLVKVRSPKRLSSTGDQPTARVVLQDGTLTTLNFAKKVRVNGVKYTGQNGGSDSVYDCPDFYDLSGNFYRQAVKLKLNGSNEITEIETATTLTTNPYGYDTSKFTLCYDAVGGYGGHGQRRVEKTYRIPDDAVIFSIPPDSEFDEEDIVVLTEKQLSDSLKTNWKLYDSSPSYDVKLAVIQLTKSTDFDSRLFVVTGAGTKLLEDGEVGKVLKGRYGGQDVEFIENQVGLFDGIVKGDVCRVVKGIGDKLMNIEVLLSTSKQKKTAFDSLPGDYEEWNNHYGQLYASSATGFVLTYDKGKTVQPFAYDTGGTYFVVYDMETNEVRGGTYEDMTSICPTIKSDGKIDDVTKYNEMVYVYQRNGWSFAVVIVKNIPND